jgi:anti-sigma B factor antagonist
LVDSAAAVNSLTRRLTIPAPSDNIRTAATLPYAAAARGTTENHASGVETGGTGASVAEALARWGRGATASQPVSSASTFAGMVCVPSTCYNTYSLLPLIPGPDSGIYALRPTPNSDPARTVECRAMSVQTPCRHLEREDIGEVTVLRLTVPRLLDDGEIVALFDGIVSLLNEEGRSHLVLNLCRAEPLASMVIGKLVMLNRRVQAAGGRLVLCGLGPRTAEILSVMRLTPLFRIYLEEQPALRSFGGQTSSSCGDKGVSRA